jgi:hypothetical protein
MPTLRDYGLFISHAWNYDQEYDGVIRLLNNAPLFNWRNYSVTRHNALDANSNRQLVIELSQQIQPVNCVIICSGMYVAHREWIQKEIEIAQNYRKPIIGIIPRGNQAIPVAVQESAAEIVGWNSASLVDAIRRNSI